MVAQLLLDENVSVADVQCISIGVEGVELPFYNHLDESEITAYLNKDLVSKQVVSKEVESTP
jgi:hypothetical protein